jgi:glycerate kinase
MKIVLAFDSYKGALTAPEACASAAEGLARLRPMPEVVACPLSDGGEGFAEAMRLAGGGRLRLMEVTGPLGDPVTAELVYLDGGDTAVVESAQACGLLLVPAAARTPLLTTTYGVGEMIGAAVLAGVRRIVVGLGGSSTNDGGMGMLAALGWQFLDADDSPLSPIGRSLTQVARIIPGNRLEGIELIAACDVINPLYGSTGAAYTFAPQKGASPGEVETLDRGLVQFAAVSAETLGRDLALTPGAGAAGGLGFALLAYLNAAFHPGAALAIELSRLEAHLIDADLCLTGEGRTDGQTAFGKLPAAVAACCSRAGVPCVGLSGALMDDWRSLYDQGFTALFSISQHPQELSEAIAETTANLADAAEAVARMVSHLRG